MSTNIDKSLDEIIASKPRVRKARRSATRGVTKAAVKPSKQSKANASGAASRPKATRGEAAPRAAPTSNPFEEASQLADKIIISNLPTDITDRAVKDYFSHEVGPITSCQVMYNSRGTSTGTVHITFRRKGDAAKAAKRFNGMSIDDGVKIMKVELIVDPSKRPLSSRLDTRKPAPPSGPRRAKPAESKGPIKTTQPKPKAKKAAAKPARRAKKTVEELDAEMADYFDNASNIATVS